MGILDSFGAYGRISKWLLSSPEIDAQVRAPYEVRRLRVDYGGTTTEIGSPLDAERSALRQASAPKSVSLRAEWRAEHNQDDIRPHKEALEELFNHDPSRGRPPRVLFRWGGIEQLEGVIASLRVDWVDGVFDFPPWYPRAFVADIVVQRQIRRRFDVATRFTRETTQRRVGSGESFEGLAQTAYGDPYLGVNLRRINPTVSLFGLRKGDVVRVLDETHPDMQRSVEPSSPALLGDVTAVLQALAEERLSQSNASGVDSLWAELGL